MLPAEARPCAFLKVCAHAPGRRTRLHACGGCNTVCIQRSPLLPCAQGDTWYKFDDDRVTIEDGKQALEEQYGAKMRGHPRRQSPRGPKGELGARVRGGTAPAVRFTQNSNAYMLVYVRVQDWSSICCSVTKEEVAAHLRDRLEVRPSSRFACLCFLGGGHGTAYMHDKARLCTSLAIISLFRNSAI